LFPEPQIGAQNKSRDRGSDNFGAASGVES
jgi:hypothetical protein